MRIVLIAVLSCIVAGASVGATVPVVLIVGDSLSAAYGLDVHAGWVHLLQRRLDDAGCAYTVVNASVSGETTRGGLTRLGRALTRHEPQLVVIALGGNDGLRGIAVEETRSNLKRMIERSRAAGADVVLAGIRIPPNYGAVYTEAFSAVYPALAHQMNVTLVPFLLEGMADDASLFQADGIHPTADAQGTIMENVWRALAPLLECG